MFLTTWFVSVIRKVTDLSHCLKTFLRMARSASLSPVCYLRKLLLLGKKRRICVGEMQMHKPAGLNLSQNLDTACTINEPQFHLDAHCRGQSAPSDFFGRTKLRGREVTYPSICWHSRVKSRGRAIRPYGGLQMLARLSVLSNEPCA